MLYRQLPLAPFMAGPQGLITIQYTSSGSGVSTGKADPFLGMDVNGDPALVYSPRTPQAWLFNETNLGFRLCIPPSGSYSCLAGSPGDKRRVEFADIIELSTVWTFGGIFNTRPTTTIIPISWQGSAPASPPLEPSRFDVTAPFLGASGDSIVIGNAGIYEDYQKGFWRLAMVDASAAQPEPY